MRAALFTAMLALAGCYGLPDILATEPVRTATFDGDYIEMAQCVQGGLPGGKTEMALDRSRITIYDSAKGYTNRGLSHYAVTVYRTGKVELRKLPAGMDMSEGVQEIFWQPVGRCADFVATAHGETPR